MNTELLSRALAHAEKHPETWLTAPEHWAIRSGSHGELTGLAGHVVLAAEGSLWWSHETPDPVGYDTTNYVTFDGQISGYRGDVAAYLTERNLEWPSGTCSIFLAARLLLGMSEPEALQLFTRSGSIDYTKGLVAGYLIGKTHASNE